MSKISKFGNLWPDIAKLKNLVFSPALGLPQQADCSTPGKA